MPFSWYKTIYLFSLSYVSEPNPPTQYALWP